MNALKPINDHTSDIRGPLSTKRPGPSLKEDDYTIQFYISKYPEIIKSEKSSEI